jgi:hypothetical protein
MSVNKKQGRNETICNFIAANDAIAIHEYRRPPLCLIRFLPHAHVLVLGCI